MIITALKQKGNNVLVCFDDGEFITLDYRTVIDNSLRKNDSIDEINFDRLIFESDILKAKDSAFRFLGRRHHSTSELRTKLIKKKYLKEVIDNVLSDLTNRNLLDDEKFANEFIEEKSTRKKIGKNKLKAELFKKGIDRKIIERVISNVNADISYDNVISLAHRKFESLKHKNIEKKKIRLKLYSYLVSRGYESDLIMKVLNELRLDDDE